MGSGVANPDYYRHSFERDKGRIIATRALLFNAMG